MLAGEFVFFLILVGWVGDLAIVLDLNDVDVGRFSGRNPG